MARWSFALLLTLASLPLSAQDPRFSNRLAPFVSSPTRVVDRMLELANIKPGETLFDLGAGDGRVLIAAVEKYKAKAVGVEISPKLVATASANIHREGLDDRARVMEGDVLTADLSGADVVTIYLATPLNEKLRPRLEKFLKPGARVISHDYAVPGWKPNHVERTGDHLSHLIYVYEMPPAKD
jgi:predicted RNA methylase